MPLVTLSSQSLPPSWAGRYGIMVGYIWPRSEKLNIKVDYKLFLFKEPLVHCDDKRGKVIQWTERL